MHVNVRPIDHPLIIFEKEFAKKPYQIDVVRTMVEPDPLLLRSRFIWGRRNCQDISARRISKYCTASATQATEVYFTKYPYYKLNMFSRVYLHEEEGPSRATNCEPKAVNK
jgi:hypothetical protein